MPGGIDESPHKNTLATRAPNSPGRKHLLDGVSILRNAAAHSVGWQSGNVVLLALALHPPHFRRGRSVSLAARRWTHSRSPRCRYLPGSHHAYGHVVDFA